MELVEKAHRILEEWVLISSRSGFYQTTGLTTFITVLRFITTRRPDTQFRIYPSTAPVRRPFIRTLTASSILEDLFSIGVLAFRKGIPLRSLERFIRTRRW